MKTEKTASKTMYQAAEFVRRVGIRSKILPKNFPKMENIIFKMLDSKNINFGGVGGFTPIQNKMIPFLIINMAYAPNAFFLMAAIAHEFLHIAQYRKDRNINHGNKFRTHCKTFADVLGVDYYLVMGYDAPSKKTAKAKAKILEKWFNSFRGREDQKSKMYQEF